MWKIYFFCVTFRSVRIPASLFDWMTPFFLFFFINSKNLLFTFVFKLHPFFLLIIFSFPHWLWKGLYVLSYLHMTGGKNYAITRYFNLADRSLQFVLVPIHPLLFLFVSKLSVLGTTPSSLPAYDWRQEQYNHKVSPGPPSSGLYPQPNHKS